MNTKRSLKPGYLPSFRKQVTLAQALELGKEYPALFESAFGRMERLILREGLDELRMARLQRLGYPKTVKSYNAFSKRFKGIDAPIHRFVNDFIVAGASNGEAAKQIFVAIGGKGSGKSQFFNALKRLARKAEPMPYNGGCPVHDNPLSMLYMIPTLAEKRIDSEGFEGDYLEALVSFKADILKSLGLDKLIDFNHPKVKSLLSKNDSALTIEGVAELDIEDLVSAVIFGLGMPEGTRGAVGHPCPFCQVKVLGLFEYAGRAVPIDQFPVGWFRYSTDFEGSIGIVDVSEVEPNNFEIGTWIGWEDLSQAGRYQPGDPRNVVLNGALPQGNRGWVMFTEGFKNPKEARRVELEATQGKRVPLPAPLVGSLFIDEMLAINSNEAEYNSWINDPANEPYKDRYMLTWFKYPLEMDAAREIFLAIWGETEFANPASPKHTHLDPMVPELAARLEILTRIEPHTGLDPNAKVDAYNGVAIRQKGQTKLSLDALRNAASAREGLTGNSPRELAKQVGALAAEAIDDGSCVTARAFFQRLVVEARENFSDEEAYKAYLKLVNTLLDESYRREASRMWLAACIEGFTGKAQEIFDKYLDNIQAFATNQSIQSPGGYTRVPGGGDTRFMREIESDPNWGVTESEAPKFRAEIMIAVNNWMKENRGKANVPYTCHEPVRRCIERYVVNQLRSTARKLSLRSVRSDEDKRHLAEVTRRLVSDYGYCEHCANELLKEVEEKESFLIES
jgi:serine protein kinase